MVLAEQHHAGAAGLIDHSRSRHHLSARHLPVAWDDASGLGSKGLAVCEPSGKGGDEGGRKQKGV
jgi:hypothetical protein